MSKKIGLSNTNRGITLVALVVTIVILLILAGVSIVALSGQNGILSKAKEAVDKTKEAQADEQAILGSLLGEIDESLNSQYNSSKGINVPKLSEGMIPVKYKDGNWVICSQDDNEWYDYTNKKWANIMLSDGTYNTTTAVGTTVADSDLGSMFVWIPRYAYSISKYKTAVSGKEGEAQNITNVTFLVGATNRDKDGNQYGIDYNTDSAKVGEATPKIVNPAFTFGGTNLTGIWSAKFEASMKETNNNTVENNNVTTKTVKITQNAESWRYIQVGKMFTNCLNMKTNTIYGINSTVDSHLMKNNEWGAIAYLSTSQYGITPTFNSSYISYQEDGTTKYHSYSAGKNQEVGGNYKVNITQSTTGNVTGIYDLNGGAWEYVAAYYDNGNRYLSGQGLTAFTNNKLKEEYTKYWDKYEVGAIEIEKAKNDDFWNLNSDSNPTRKYITTDRYNLMKNIKGDAMYEVINTYSYYGKKTDGNYDWLMGENYSSVQYGSSYYNNDYALIGNCSHPFLIRGGYWSDGSHAGVFAFYGSYGGVYTYVGFRPVLSVL